MAHSPPSLAPADVETLREAFWELFRQGYVTLGIDENNAGWPFFKLSRFGRQALSEGAPYRFTDTKSYLDMVRRFAPDLDPVATAYLDEAVQAFHAGCILASNVMLGVAAEHRFDLLLNALAASPTHQKTFEPAVEQKLVLRRITEFNKRLEPMIPHLPSEVREGLKTQLTTVQEVIRGSRNDAGHPTGKAPDREAAYVLLQMYAPFARKVYQLQHHLCF